MISGTLQINVRVPDVAITGPNVPITLNVGDYSSSSDVTLAVQ
jgi:uncharacterized protein (TIGR03437 family)